MAPAPVPVEATPAVDPGVAPQTTEAVPPEAVAEAPTEVAAEEPAELSAAELANLGLGGGEAGESALDTSLKFWGFADFTIQSLVGGKDSAWRGILGRHASFFIGNFNLYLSKNITERIRTMGEVRFTYLPNGVSDARTGALYSTSVTDYANNTLDTRWGTVIPQRIYVEVELHELAILRIGQFLTPYGVWNIDHGSPAIVPVQRPSMLNQNLFPERQTGFELLGRSRVGADHVLGYHLTLSNGFGPVSEYRDLDDNKAVGARAYWQWEKLGQLQIGGSALYALDTAATQVPGVDATGKYVFNEKIASQSKVLSLAADLRWTYGGFLLQSEVVAQQRAFTDEGRVGSPNPLVGGRWVALQDGITWGGYGLAGYRFQWLGVMPYVVATTFDIRDPRTLSEVASRSANFGVNLRPVDAFVVKLEYVYAGWAKKNFISDDPIQQIYAQVAWAF